MTKARKKRKNFRHVSESPVVEYSRDTGGFSCHQRTHLVSFGQPGCLGNMPKFGIDNFRTFQAYLTAIFLTCLMMSLTGSAISGGSLSKSGAPRQYSKA